MEKSFFHGPAFLKAYFGKAYVRVNVYTIPITICPIFFVKNNGGTLVIKLHYLFDIMDDQLIMILSYHSVWLNNYNLKKLYYSFSGIFWTDPDFPTSRPSWQWISELHSAKVSRSWAQWDWAVSQVLVINRVSTCSGMATVSQVKQIGKQLMYMLCFCFVLFLRRGGRGEGERKS